MSPWSRRRRSLEDLVRDLSRPWSRVSPLDAGRAVLLRSRTRSGA